MNILHYDCMTPVRWVTKRNSSLIGKRSVVQEGLAYPLDNISQWFSKVATSKRRWHPFGRLAFAGSSNTDDFPIHLASNRYILSSTVIEFPRLRCKCWPGSFQFYAFHVVYIYQAGWPRLWLFVIRTEGVRHFQSCWGDSMKESLKAIDIHHDMTLMLLCEYHNHFTCLAYSLRPPSRDEQNKKS